MPPWPVSYEWRANRNRVVLVRLVHMDIGIMRQHVLDLGADEAAMLLEPAHQASWRAALAQARRPLRIVVAHDDRRIRASGDGQWHLCLGLDGSARVMCVYRPPAGF